MLDWRLLKTEIGSEAFAELDEDEVAYICKSFTSDQIYQAAQKAFEILWKKFRPNYRMGRSFKALSDKYQTYYNIYLHYCRRLSGSVVSADTEDQDVLYIYDRFKP